MKKRAIKILLLAAVLTAFFAVTASAKTVYLQYGKTGTGETASSPVGTFSDAISKVAASGDKIAVIGEFPINEATSFPEIDFDYTITAGADGCIVMSTLANYISLGVNDNTNVITFDLPLKVTGSADVNIYGSFNSVVFTKNFKVTSLGSGMLNYYGGRPTGGVPGVCTKAYSITVNGGTFNSFNGGNYRSMISAYVGSIAAPISITVNGGTFGRSGTYENNNNKSYDAFSISGMAILASDATLTINGGTFNCPIFAQGKLGTVSCEASEKSTKVASDRKYYAIDGNIKINIKGGTFNGGLVSAYYTQAAYTQLVRGNFDVTVTGGTFKSGTVFDATQVKAYKGKTNKATLTYSGVSGITEKRFDTVNGTAVTYTEPTRVVFIGDSITEGYVYVDAGVNRLTESYPAQFLKLCENAGKEVIVSNFGVSSSGLHPATIRDYFKMLAYPIVSEETDPTYVFFAIGTNDAQTIGGTTSALRLYEKNLSDFALEMGALPNTKKVFITSAIYRYTNNGKADMRAASVLRPSQRRVAEALSAKNASKYFFVDMYGLTLPAAKDDSLFIANNGVLYERLHPAQNGLALMGRHCYNAIYSGTLSPTTDYQKNEIYISAGGGRLASGSASDPIGDVAYAFSLAKHGEVVKIYISGELTNDFGWALPAAPSKVVFIGTGTTARLGYSNTESAGAIKLGTTTRFENITLGTSGTSLAIIAAYNGVEIYANVKTAGSVDFIAGHNVYGDVDPAENYAHDSEEYVSSDATQYIEINGGSYTNFLGGNARYSAKSPLGTFSGSMTLIVGPSVKVGNANSTQVGICGRNYLTGKITTRLEGWGSGVIDEFAPIGSLSGIKYDHMKNTGRIVFKNCTVTNKINYVGDFNDDGDVNVKDALLAIDYVLNGFDTAKSDKYQGKKLTTLLEAVRILKKTTY